MHASGGQSEGEGEDQSGGRAGTVCTFYSYKGGVGRSMALANVAALLSRFGRKVLIIDWDLEAPGLERFFDPYLSGSRKQTPGIVDLFAAFAAGEESDWRRHCLKVRIPGGEPISLLHAGLDDGLYLDRLRSIDWQDAAKRGLGEMLEKLRFEWKSAFEYVLIDSRTGLTDIGGICAIQLPDYLVSLFTTNEQSLAGVADTMRRAKTAHEALGVDRKRLVIIPIPSRDESNTEYNLALDWRRRFSNELRPFYEAWIPETETAETVLEILKIPYVAYWSFGEKLPVLQEDPENPKLLAYSYALIANLIAGELNWAGVVAGRRGTAIAIAEQQARLEKERLSLREDAEQARQKRLEENKQLVDDRFYGFADRTSTRIRDRALEFRLSVIPLTLAVANFLACFLVPYRVFLFNYLSIDLGARSFFDYVESFYGASFLAMLVVAGLTAAIYFTRSYEKERLEELVRERDAYELRSESYEDLSDDAALKKFATRMADIMEEKAPSLVGRLSRWFGLKALKNAPVALARGRTPTAEAPPSSSQIAPPPVPREATAAEAAAPSIEDIDVYLSCADVGIAPAWMDAFLPIFRLWLTEALGRQPNIWFAPQSLQPGERWNESVARAIASSKACVVILSRGYLNSKPARRELDLMQDQRKPIVPLLLDKELSSSELSDFEIDSRNSFADMAFVGEGFSRSERFVEFQPRVRDFAYQVARRIQSADSLVPSA
jgi:cellulose biosynthesis protein BcsQ